MPQLLAALLVRKKDQEEFSSSSAEPIHDHGDRDQKAKVMEAMRQADSWIQQLPPEQIPPALVEAKEAAIERMHQQLHLTSSAASASNNQCNNSSNGKRTGASGTSTTPGTSQNNTNEGSTNKNNKKSEKLKMNVMQNLDWGVVAIYSCTACCDTNTHGDDEVLGAYREEFAWRQPSLDAVG